MLEQAKTKLEMSMAAQKKEHRRELSAKDDELEDARASTQKKVSSNVALNSNWTKYHSVFKESFKM